jgi:hypothetical protein
LAWFERAKLRDSDEAYDRACVRAADPLNDGPPDERKECVVPEAVDPAELRKECDADDDDPA